MGRRLFSGYFGLSAFIFLTVLSLLICPSSVAAKVIPGHRLSADVLTQPAGRLDPNQVLQLSIGLPVRDPASLKAFLGELYDPSSPQFRQFLRPDEFGARFGASQSDYDALVTMADRHSLTIVRRDKSRLALHVRATAAQVEAAFHLHLNNYYRDDKSTFYAPDADPDVDLACPVLHISGLDSFGRRTKPATAGPHGSGPLCSGTGSLLGSDFRKAYVPGVTLTGAGQTVALLEFDDYYDTDISNYALQAGQGVPSLSRVVVGQALAPPACANSEVCLDIEMVMSMAPQAQILVYEEGQMVYSPPYCYSSGPAAPLLARIADDDLAQQISCSWGWGGPNDGNEQQSFLQFAAQGQTFFSAAGDSGAYGPEGPYSSPFQPLMESDLITVVGGTTLSTGAGGSYASETTWNDSLVNSQPAPTATRVATPFPNLVGSGGICDGAQPLAIPTYQAGLANPGNAASSVCRNIPDVSMPASHIYITYSHGYNYACSGGTSAAAPLWTGFMALVNQQAALQGHPAIGLGWLNPTLYALAASPTAYAADFHDIADGSNNSYWLNNANRYKAVAGYDLCTGLGSPREALIGELVAKTTPLPTRTPFPAAAPNQIMEAVAVPNPDPLSLAVRFSGRADAVRVMVFTDGFSLVADIKVQKALVEGWNQVPLTPGWSKGLANGSYFVCLSSTQSGKAHRWPGAVKVYLSK